MGWRGAIAQILYCVQYVAVLDGRAASEVSRAIIARRCLSDGPQAYLDAIDAALLQERSVCVVSTPHDDNDVRPFLQALAGEIRRNHPWSPPPALELRLDNWTRLFGTAQPVGRIELRQLEVSQLLGFEFGDITGMQEPGLLLRLKSGAVVGLLAPAMINHAGVSIFSGSEAHARQAIDEISRMIDLHPSSLTVFVTNGQSTASSTQLLKQRQPGLLPDLEPLSSGVERWSAERIERQRVVVDEEGFFRTIDGGVLDTRMATASWRTNAELALFIMDPHGNFYVSLRRVIGRIHHSTLSGGGPVAAAGELRVREGRLSVITDHSGHYPPTRSANQIVVSELQSRGVAMEDVLLDFAATEWA